MATGLYSEGERGGSLGISPELSEYGPLSSTPGIDSMPFLAGASDATAIAVIAFAKTGTVHPLYEQELYNKVIVTPRALSVGFAVSELLYTVELWNAARRGVTLSNITIAGQAGVTVDNPYGSNLDIADTDNLLFTVRVSPNGSPTIDNLITFNIAEGYTGTDVDVEGTRLVVFAVPINWDGGLKERREYLTDMLTGYDGSEQRIQLRAVPRHHIAYRVDCDSAKSAGNMEALIYGWQQRPYAVPWWIDAQPLLQDVGIGATTIYVDTSNREFMTGGVVLLYKGQFDYEAFTVTTVNPGNVIVANQAGKAWKAYEATVLPAKIARGSNLTVERANALLAGASVAFDVEVV